MSDLLVLIRCTTVSINIMSLSYMGKSCLDPNVTHNEILRMCSSVGGPQHVHPDTKWTSWRWAWEHALKTSRHTERVGHNYVSSFSSLLYLTIIFFLKSLRFYYTKSYFLLSPRKLTVWLGSLQREEFSICGPRVYTHQPLFLARNNKASLLF